MILTDRELNKALKYRNTMEDHFDKYDNRIKKAKQAGDTEFVDELIKMKAILKKRIKEANDEIEYYYATIKVRV